MFDRVFITLLILELFSASTHCSLFLKTTDLFFLQILEVSVC